MHFTSFFSLIFFRFSPTRPPVHWTGVRSAMVHSPVCPQVLPEVSNATEALQRMSKRRFDYLNKVIPQLQSQSEDCLFLNIYVPSKKRNPDFILLFIRVLHK